MDEFGILLVIRSRRRSRPPGSAVARRVLRSYLPTLIVCADPAHVHTLGNHQNSNRSIHKSCFCGYHTDLATASLRKVALQEKTSNSNYDSRYRDRNQREGKEFDLQSTGPPEP